MRRLREQVRGRAELGPGLPSAGELDGRNVSPAGAARIVERACGLRLSKSAIENRPRAVKRRIGPVVEGIPGEVRNSPVVGGDESPTWTDGRRGWYARVLAARRCAHYGIRRSRAACLSA